MTELFQSRVGHANNDSIGVLSILQKAKLVPTFATPVAGPNRSCSPPSQLLIAWAKKIYTDHLYKPKHLGAPGIATRNKDATRGSFVISGYTGLVHRPGCFYTPHRRASRWRSLGSKRPSAAPKACRTARRSRCQGLDRPDAQEGMQKGCGTDDLFKPRQLEERDINLLLKLAQKDHHPEFSGHVDVK